MDAVRMTLQMSDIVSYRRPWSLRKRFFSLAAMSGTELFNPTAHGLTPVACCTGLYCGFLCEYVVEREQLLLGTLNIFQDDHEVELFGVTPHIDAEGLGWSSYRSLNHSIPFTGGLLIGCDYLQELCDLAGGSSPAWLYRRVYELVFESGR